MSSSHRSQVLGHGGIPTLLLTFSLPAIVGMMAQALYYVVDRVFVGRCMETMAWRASRGRLSLHAYPDGLGRCSSASAARR